MIENVFLLHELTGHIHVGTVYWASTCARWKFGLLGGAAVWVILLTALRRRAPAARGSDGPAES